MNIHKFFIQTRICDRICSRFVLIKHKSLSRVLSFIAIFEIFFPFFNLYILNDSQRHFFFIIFRFFFQRISILSKSIHVISSRIRGKSGSVIPTLVGLLKSTSGENQIIVWLLTSKIFSNLRILIRVNPIRALWNVLGQ